MGNKIKVKARLINKDRPVLLIKKDKKLKTQRYYKINLIDKKQDKKLSSYLQNFNNDFYCFKFVYKILGSFNLKYKETYNIEIEEDGYLNEKYSKISKRSKSL